jgi:hypothetical protein
MRRDEITLTLPRRRDYYEIAHLVLGGLAIRLDVTLEHLDDLEVALASVLEQHDADGEVTIALRVEDGALQTVIGPFPGDRLRSALRREDDEQLGLRRLLNTVCDGVSVEEREGGEWIELTKAFEVSGAP